MTDWREKALANQVAMADLHKRRTASESRAVIRGLEQKRKTAIANSTSKQVKYWKKRAERVEAALRRIAKVAPPAAGPSFYDSREWRTLRYKALKLHGAKCQLCGDTGKLHVDHIKPRFKFPELELRLDNLQVLCEDCNLGKGAWDQSDWRRGTLKSIPGD